MVEITLFLPFRINPYPVYILQYVLSWYGYGQLSCGLFVHWKVRIIAVNSIYSVLVSLSYFVGH